MTSNKEVVLLTGASGSMGFETFRVLWGKRDRYDLVLLLRPSRKNKRMFRRFEKEAGITPVPGSGTLQGKGLKVVWGDALNREDVAESCRGIHWCLHPMALISPAADRDPEMARRVNVQGTRYLVEAIESQDPENIRMVSVGSVAMYGDRLPPVHVGRVGDPLLPSVFDHYANTKIEAELAVMESRIRHRASLRQTFIMIPGLFSLMDPIMFHQPVQSRMENITARDAGRLLAACLDVPEGSDFWGGFYNVSGGQECRTTYLEFLHRIYSMLGIDYRRAMDRSWFALKNFHMQFFEDAGVLNVYLHHWDGGQSMEDFYREVWKALPVFLKATSWFNRKVPPFRWLVQRITRMQLKQLAVRPGGTLRWIRDSDQDRIRAFYGSTEAYRAIPGWDDQIPSPDHDPEYRRLDHGYDESAELTEMEDLKKAARFRGGSLLSGSWDGGMASKLSWECCQGHTFQMTPQSVLKGGHWCLECISPPWDYRLLAEKSRFAAQLLPV